MISISAESLRWLSESLHLPLVEEAENGSIRANPTARKRLGKYESPELADAIGTLVEIPVDTAVLGENIERARKGEAVEYISKNGLRILVMPANRGRACALVVPEKPTRTEVARPAPAPALAPSMSHELANALGAIGGWARLARSGHRVTEALELIEQASRTASSIAGQLLGRDRKDTEAKPRLTDLSVFVDEAARLLTPKAQGAGVIVKTNIAPGQNVSGSRDDVWTVIWNPMINAVEAMPHGGTLSIRLSCDREWVRLVIEDEGSGIDDKIRDRIFQPYFTTKAKGTGIGLALVKQGVDAMNGNIKVDSARGKGTRFQIELPRIPETKKDGIEKGSDKDRTSGVYVSEPINGRILVVDDDPALRDMMYTALAMRGADVVAVATPQEALALDGRFDLALVDMRLGDQSGDTLLAELRAADKIEAGLIVTGSETLPELAAGGQPDGVLRKPFQLEDLYERVTAILGSEEREERVSEAG